MNLNAEAADPSAWEVGGMQVGGRGGQGMEVVSR